MDELVRKAEELFRNRIPESRKKDVYIKHVELVRKYALILGKEYGADLVVVEVAALLHDICAGVKNHASRSAEIADEFMTKEGVDRETKEKILSAIKNHSSVRQGVELSHDVPIEDQIIRDADSISFLEDGYKWYLEISLDIESCKEEAKKASLDKIRRMLAKAKTKKGLEMAKRFYKPAEEYITKF